MKSLLKLAKIGKTFRLDGIKVQALKNINLQIEAGELVSILGPSGSGKSTLMYILGCLSRPTQGTYYFQGKETSQLTDNQLADIRNERIGFVFQSFNLLPRVNALANVELPLIYTDKNETEMRKIASQKLAQLGLKDRINHRPNQLSGGQQQRVAIARALVNKPQLIIADEPTGNVDTKTGQEIMKIFKDLNQKGQTIIIVTHDPQIAKFSRRQIELVDGQIKTDT